MPAGGDHRVVFSVRACPWAGLLEGADRGVVKDGSHRYPRWRGFLTGREITRSGLSHGCSAHPDSGVAPQQRGKIRTIHVLDEHPGQAVTVASAAKTPRRGEVGV